VLGADRVTRSDAGYALAADWVDVAVLDQLRDEAERRLSEKQPAAAATAAKAGLALVRGPLLADEHDAEWAHEARRSVDRSLGRLRLVAAEASLATGDPFGAASAAQAALDEDPYDEHALRLLMTAQARAGRPASALGAYAKTREILAGSLGASPSELTEALHLAILCDELPPLATAPTERLIGKLALPGRDLSWRSLDRALARAEERVELIVVEGEAGIGKTKLLETWSAAMAADGGVVLWGTCDALGATLPFQAVLDALDGHLARAELAEADRLRSLAGPVLGPLLRGHAGPAGPQDPLTAQAALFSGALQVCCRAGGSRPALLVIDDVHLADPATLAWLAFAARRPMAGPLLIVVASRSGPRGLPHSAERICLGPLDLGAATEIVGAERAPKLLERSGGNPLFLVELARFEGDDLPASILDAVTARFTRAGETEKALRTAAVLGPEVDLDLLSGVLQQSAVSLLADLEEGQRLMILDERGTEFVFRHELLRDALVAGTGTSRRALVHREAARLLAARPNYDPLVVATHARQGGERELAAAALIEAAAVASSRFDHAGAEHLLDQSLGLFPLPHAYLARGRARLTREDFVGAASDAARALERGPRAEALELASWSAYYQRDFLRAQELCQQAQSALADSDGDLKASVLALAGRISHANGDLDSAQNSLQAALPAASPGGRAAVAGVWLGWLLADRGEPAQAERLADMAGMTTSVSVHPFGSAHRALLGAYASALQARAAQAFLYLDEVDREVDRRGLEHFVGRSANYRAWLLRNLLSPEEADELNMAAAEIASARALREPQAQSALDLADGRLRRRDLQGAASALSHAASLGSGFAFAWKARLRHQLLSARLALADDRPEEAGIVADAVAAEASRIVAPRLVTLARVVSVQASCAAGQPDPRSAERLVHDLARFAAPESWWVTAELALAFGVDGWWKVAEQRTAVIAAGAGTRAEEFGRQAGRWLDRMRSSRFRGRT
jgi:tetratricopeptide (TPR) repeat protein